MKNEQLLKKLSECALFKGINVETLEKIVAFDGISTQKIPKNDIISLRDKQNSTRLCIMLSGKASVMTPDAEHRVLLRFLGNGDLFGIANLFSDTPFVSTVRAVSDCICMFIAENTVRLLLDENADFRNNYIDYLSGRIRFLNRKIGYLTAGSAERRLALYLSGLGQGEVTLQEPISALSDLLNLGRASLYRAFDRLCADGWLKKNGKKLVLTDPSAMLKFYKN